MWSTQFVEVNEADAFLEFPCFLYVLANVGNLISGSSAFAKPIFNVWKFYVHIMLKPSLEELSITLLVWEMSITVQWLEHSLVLPFLGTGMRMDLFLSSGPCWFFQIFWHIEWSTLLASSFRILNSFAGILSPPLALWAAVLLKIHLIHIPECLALSEKIHHCDYLGH